MRGRRFSRRRSRVRTMSIRSRRRSRRVARRRRVTVRPLRIGYRF